MEGKNIEMTLKELISLENEGKLKEYQGMRKFRWKDTNEEACLWYFEKNDFLAYNGFTLFMHPDGTYEIVEGNDRISFLLEFVKTLEKNILELLFKENIVVDILFNGSENELNYIYHRINLSCFLNEPKKKRVSLSKKEKKEIEYYLSYSNLKIPNVIENHNIEKEIINLWGFNPYEIMTTSAFIRRDSDSVNWLCLNCRNIFATTLKRLEEFCEKDGWYCPTCHGTLNPVYSTKLTEEHYADKRNDKYKESLLGEQAIMADIKEHYGYQPYDFIRINNQKSIHLLHRCCNYKFEATPAMLLEDNIFTDKYNGEKIKLPFCPKCNTIFVKKGISFGGSRMVRHLVDRFKSANIDMPYLFAEDDLYRFRDYSMPIIITCKHCKQKFSNTSDELFAGVGERSLCPYCH